MFMYDDGQRSGQNAFDQYFLALVLHTLFYPKNAVEKNVNERY